MELSNAWARNLLLTQLAGTGIGAFDRAAVVIENLCDRAPSLAWLLLALSAAAALVAAGFVVYAAAVVVIGIVAFVLLEIAALVLGVGAALWAFASAAVFAATVYAWAIAVWLGLRSVWGIVLLGIHASAPAEAVATTARSSKPAARSDPYLDDVPEEEEAGFGKASRTLSAPSTT